MHLLDTPAVASALRVSPRTVADWRLARRGYGPPFVRLSHRCIRYDPLALARWVDARTRA